jgi:hypothetical protein
MMPVAEAHPAAQDIATNASLAHSNIMASARSKISISIWAVASVVAMAGWLYALTYGVVWVFS